LVGVNGRGEEEQIMSTQGEAFRTVTVPLRLEWLDGLIRTIQLTVVDLDDLTEEIRLDGQTIGFINRAGRIFVAQSGTRLDRAEECGQCLLWDKAAAILVTLLGRLPEPEEPDPRSAMAKHTSGSRDADTAHAPNRQSRPAYEMSR
jgi:hypothetical protein